MRARIIEGDVSISEFADDVARWHLQTFGECSTERVFKKVKEEMVDEFLVEPSNEEAADVIIALFAWSFRNGGDLPAELVRKFEVVRARTDQIERDRERGIVEVNG